jgi:hypothetical protein
MVLMSEIRTETVRERMAMKARARAILQRLIDFFALHGSLDQDFKGELIMKGKHTAQDISTYANERLRETLANDMPNLTLRFDHGRTLSTLGLRIMRALADGVVVPETDLDGLTAIINVDIRLFRLPIRWYPEQRKYGRDSSEHASTAESLLEYMTLSARYGPQHSICAREGCNSLMIAGRGAKKFCSPRCRKAAWAYEGKKDYYQAHKKDSRKNRKRNKTKGTVHGKTRK